MKAIFCSIALFLLVASCQRNKPSVTKMIRRFLKVWTLCTPRFSQNQNRLLQQTDFLMTLFIRSCETSDFNWNE